MEKDKIISTMYDAIIALDRVQAEEMADQAIAANLDLPVFIDQAMSGAMNAVGAKFQSGEMFLPELQMSAEVFEAAMERINPQLAAANAKVSSKGRVIIGTVKGDLHSIGKNLVATMLKAAGFEVTDLGVDVPTLTFLEAMEKSEPDVIALSARLTTTMPVQKEVIEAIVAQGWRDRVKVLIGGAPVNQEWAQTIGADAYGDNAAAAVRLTGELVG